MTGVQTCALPILVTVKGASKIPRVISNLVSAQKAVMPLAALLALGLSFSKKTGAAAGSLPGRP